VSPSAVFGRIPDAMVVLLARCVRLGPSTPADTPVIA
jgi:hypothetical protein